MFIELGSPWESSSSESQTGILREKVLDPEIFYTLREVQVLIEGWRQHYNGVRPHSALAYRPPAPEARSWARLALPPRSELGLTTARN